MIINDEIFCLPPHISTSWGHVIALSMQEEKLVISLSDGTFIKISDLPNPILERIFACHAAYLEKQGKSGANRMRKPTMQTSAGTGENEEAGDMLELPLRIGINSLQGMSTALHHNPEQAHLPDLPADMLDKISSIAKLVAGQEIPHMPKPEPHCNCMHCQIMRAVHRDDPVEEPVVKEAKLEEVHISPRWKVEQCGENLYNVTSTSTPEEIYKVFLGEQVGCTCGMHGCEHILAVLRS